MADQRYDERLVAMERQLDAMRRQARWRGLTTAGALAGAIGLGAVALGDDVVSGPLKVRAPFEVVNDAGQTVMAVGIDGALRMFVNDHAVIQLATSIWEGKPEGHIQIGVELDQSYLTLFADHKRTGLMLQTLEGNLLASLDGEAMAGSVLTLNSMYGSKGAVVMRQTNDGGVVEVKGPDDSVAVWAGVTPEGLGMVRAGPGGAAAVAKGGEAASSIQAAGK